MKCGSRGGITRGMTTICDTYQINESDYIRKSLMQSVREDLKLTENADTKFLFV